MCAGEQKVFSVQNVSEGLLEGSLTAMGDIRLRGQKRLLWPPPT